MIARKFSLSFVLLIFSGLPIFSVANESPNFLLSPYSFGIIGDAGLWNENTSALLDSMKATNVRQIIAPGDNLYDLTDTYKQVWGPWFDAGFKFPLVALGNHLRTYGEEISFFSMPGEYYSKSFGRVARFIILNSDNEENPQEQIAFLRATLDQATEKFIFIEYHHPTFTITKSHDWEEKEEFQLALRQVLKVYRQRITALIVGHDHIASLLHVSEVPMIVSGSTQETRSAKPVNYVEDGFEVQTIWLGKKKPFWARLDFDVDSDEVWVNFIEGKSSEIHCTTRIHPRPILTRKNCLQTSRTLKEL